MIRNLNKSIIDNLVDKCGQYDFKQDRVSRLSWETNNFNYGASFLFSLVKYLQPKAMIELGTFEAHGTMLLYETTKSYNPSIITIDWDQAVNTGREDYQLINKARKESIKKANKKGGKIKFINGDTRIVLKSILPKIKQVDLVFQDSMHSLPGLAEEFDLIRPYLSTNGIFIIDDWWMVKLKHWYLYPYLKNRFQKNESENKFKGPCDMSFNWFEVNRGKGFLVGQRVL